jgi:hypothetical protein
MLTPLVLLHWLFSVELLVADVTLKRSVIPVGTFMYLKWKHIDNDTAAVQF